MASSSYYQSQMNRISKSISNKKKRKNTCRTVKSNLLNNGSFSTVNSHMRTGSSYLENGLYGLVPALSVDDDLRADRENMPDTDRLLSSAIRNLQLEIEKLDREIDDLQAQYNTAQSNFQEAKSREWQELVQKLKDTL